jgi:hypothetical protein
MQRACPGATLVEHTVEVVEVREVLILVALAPWSEENESATTASTSTKAGEPFIFDR